MLGDRKFNIYSMIKFMYNYHCKYPIICNL